MQVAVGASVVPEHPSAWIAKSPTLKPESWAVPISAATLPAFVMTTGSGPATSPMRTVPRSSVPAAVRGDVQWAAKLTFWSGRAESEWTARFACAVSLVAVHATVMSQLAPAATGAAVQVSSSMLKSAASNPSSPIDDTVSAVALAGTGAKSPLYVTSMAGNGTDDWNRRSATIAPEKGLQIPLTRAASDVTAPPPSWATSRTVNDPT